MAKIRVLSVVQQSHEACEPLQHQEVHAPDGEQLRLLTVYCASPVVFKFSAPYSAQRCPRFPQVRSTLFPLSRTQENTMKVVAFVLACLVLGQSGNSEDLSLFRQSDTALYCALARHKEWAELLAEEEGLKGGILGMHIFGRRTLRVC